MLRKSDYDATYGFVAFPRAEEILRPDGSSNGWLSYSRDTAEVSNVPGFEWVINKKMISGAHFAVELFAGIRSFVRGWSSLLSVADARGQFSESRPEVDDRGDYGADSDQGRLDKIGETVQLQF